MKALTDTLIVLGPALVAIGAAWQASIADYDSVRLFGLNPVPEFFPFRRNKGRWDAQLLRRARWDLFGWWLIIFASIVGYVAAVSVSHNFAINLVIGIIGSVSLVSTYRYFYVVKRRIAKKMMPNSSEQ